MRIAFNLLSLLSLLLCIAVIILWFRSDGTADCAARCRDSSEVGVISSIGRIIFYSESAIDPFRWKDQFGFQCAARPAPDSLTAYRMPTESRYGDVMGFGVISGDNGRYRVSSFFVPHWFVAALGAITPILWIRRRAATRVHRGFEPTLSIQK